MDDVLREFLAEAAESLDVVEADLTRFERRPDDMAVLGEIFRQVHSIKGACGFLGLPRLETLAHAAEALLAAYRDGGAVTPAGISALLAAADRIKAVLGALERTGEESAGADDALVADLRRLADRAAPPSAAAAAPNAESHSPPDAATLDDLERAFRETPGPDDIAPSADAAGAGEPDAVSQPAVARSDAGMPATGNATAGNAMAGNAAGNVRVNLAALENLMTVVGELVLARNQLLEVAQRVGPGEFKAPLQRLTGATRQLQDGIMKTRMQPISTAWAALPRIVRDLCGELGKTIELDMTGGDTEVDRQVLDLIKDPLVHMVRNAADHALEDRAERLRCGKPETGRITLSARHDGGHIVVTVADDGRGLDDERIKARALALGLASEAELASLSSHSLHKLIFRPGFSTVAQVSAVSGRGVGLDVVRTNMELIGGSIEASSVAGEGTAFIIRIPLTLAIAPALIVEAGGQRFALPQLAVSELVRARPDGEPRIERIDSASLLRLRGDLLPLARLAGLLRIAPGDCEPAEEGLIAVLRIAAQRFGLLVDAVAGSEEIVVKPSSAVLRETRLFSGNTILGDGSVVMILDPNGLERAVLGDSGALAPPEPLLPPPENSEDDKTALLIVRAGDEELKAVPLDRVTRLDEIDTASVECLGGRAVTRFRGAVMPLIALGPARADPDAGARPVLIVGDEQRAVGLLVNEIVDIVEASLQWDAASTADGIPAFAIVDGRAMEVVDVDLYLAPGGGDQRFRPEDARSAPTHALSARPRGEDCAAVLLAESDAFFRDLLSAVLASDGWRVVAAATLTEAVALKEEGAYFAAIVADLDASGVDALDLPRVIAADARWNATPVVGLTSAAPHMRCDAHQRGFASVIGKLDRTRLRRCLRDLAAGYEVAA